VQESFYVVSIGEAFHMVELVLEDSLVEIARETYIKSAREAAHDVCAVASPIVGSHGGFRDASTSLSMTDCVVLLRNGAAKY